MSSPEHFFRAAFSKESAFKVASTYVNARGLKRGSMVSPDREIIPIENALNTFGDRYAGIPGAQQYAASLTWYMTANWFTDLADLFQAALGVKDVVLSPTFVSSANNFTITTSGLAAASIVRVVSNESTPKTYICPVDIDASGVLTLGIGLPLTKVATSIVNPGSAAGGCFDYAVGNAADTFSIESDWSGKPSSTGQEVILANGCALTSFQLVYERGAPLQIATKFMGAVYAESGGAGVNTADPSAWTAEGPSWCGDFFVSTAASILWTDAKTPLKALAIEMGPSLVVDTGSQGLDGGSTSSSVLPGSDITGYQRNAGWEGLVTIRVPYAAQNYIDFKAQTPTRLFGVMYPGVPGGAPIGTARTAISIRRMIPVGRPKVVSDAGGRFHELTYQIERDRTTNSNQERLHLARFS